MGEEKIVKKEVPWIVKNVVAQKNYTLIITFSDGKRKIFDAKTLLEKEYYQQLKNIETFLKAKVVGDSVAWSDEIDIAPEYLYDNSIEL